MSREKKFTPGPWFSRDLIYTGSTDGERRHAVLFRDGARGRRLDDLKGGFRKEDAELIAKAPELYAACEETERIIADIVLNADWGGETPRLTREQCDAIADLGWKLRAALSLSPVTAEGAVK